MTVLAKLPMFVTKKKKKKRIKENKLLFDFCISLASSSLSFKILI